jgi:pimeloyl-ACP methyl ester carboxylesterase
MNTELKYTGPDNQTVVTETVVEFVQQGSTLSQQVMGEKHNVSGTHNINGKLCFPVGGAPSASSVQLLTHGVGFDKSYWDFFSAQYSYQDAAALKGYTTFSYDRLGTGLSDHPDPIQVVQGPLEVAIAHSLIQLLRSGAIGSTSFKKVIGVGHSFGSDITNAITAQYPQDVDAAVLTGFSVDSTGMIPFLSGLDLVIANEAQPARFGALPNGYLIAQSQAGNQFSFFRFPGFAQELLVAGTAAGQTFIIGEFFT